MPQTGTSGQVGFNNTAQDELELTSLDGSVVIVPTPSGFDLEVNSDLCAVAAALPDNGLLIGG